MLYANNISKRFMADGTEVAVLKNVSVSIEEGEFVSIMGRSGSGKTTLLNVLSTLVRADEGELCYRDINLSEAKEGELNGLRQSDFSVIFQFHHLLPYLTVLENTLLPYMQSMRPVEKKDVARARQCLERVGLLDKAERLPGNLSGGEQQRVAIARALVKKSKVLFADEPTGSLDKGTGAQIMDLLSELNQEGLTVIMVTHDPAYAKLAQRTIHIEDGMIKGNGGHGGHSPKTNPSTLPRQLQSKLLLALKCRAVWNSTSDYQADQENRKIPNCGFGEGVRQ